MSQPKLLHVLSRLRGANGEGVILALLIAFTLGVGAVHPSFWSYASCFAIAANSVVPLLLALGVLGVLLTGGIDISFAAVAIFSGYAAVRLTFAWHIPGAVLPFLLAIAIGLMLGLFNGAVTSLLSLPVLIVTLGTQSIIAGALINGFGSTQLSSTPSALDALTQLSLVTRPAGYGQVTQLTIFVIPAAAVCVAAALVTRYTRWGRQALMVGGNAEAARRVGVPVPLVRIAVFVVVGALDGGTGLIHITMAREANPFELVGTELDVIAAVIIGGASVFGGRGSVWGVVLGVVLLETLDSGLVYLGVSSAWHTAFVGAILLLGVTAQAILRRRRLNTSRDKQDSPETVAA